MTWHVNTPTSNLYELSQQHHYDDYDQHITYCQQLYETQIVQYLEQNQYTNKQQQWQQLMTRDLPHLYDQYRETVSDWEHYLLQQLSSNNNNKNNNNSSTEEVLDNASHTTSHSSYSTWRENVMEYKNHLQSRIHTWQASSHYYPPPPNNNNNTAPTNTTSTTTPATTADPSKPSMTSTITNSAPPPPPSRSIFSFSSFSSMITPASIKVTISHIQDMILSLYQFELNQVQQQLQHMDDNIYRYHRQWQLPQEPSEPPLDSNIIIIDSYAKRFEYAIRAHHQQQQSESEQYSSATTTSDTNVDT
jgi:hypothetical protein